LRLIMKQIPESELIINKDGSLYHINLLPEDISDTIITVGDPDRVAVVSKHFDKIEIKKAKREFITHTGYFNGQRIAVISTGIGTDNIDIVYNELDALANIDLKTRYIKEKHTVLNFIRLGTSGALQYDIPIDSFVFSQFGLGLDGLMNFYKWENTDTEKEIIDSFRLHYPTYGILPQSYLASCSPILEKKLSEGMFKGITASCSGFYAPQGRVLRFELAREDMLEKLNSFRHNDLRITNFEMETGAIYGLGSVLGHECCSVNAIVANRIRHEYSIKAHETVDKLTQVVLERLTS
ncbi:MAG: nucleoside phosphorylase, partial [Bacteroidia bacterium]